MDGYLVPHLELKECLFIRRPKKRIAQDDDAYVFHSVDAKLRDKHLVILLEREGSGEQLFKELDRSLHQFKPLFRLSKLCLRLPAVDAHGHFEPRVIFEPAVRPGCQGINVGADGRTCLEGNQLPVLRNG